MKPETGKALTWTACGLMALAMMIPAPTGAFFLLALAASCAAVPTLFGAPRLRLMAGCFLVVALVLTARAFPAFQRDQKAYRQRALERGKSSRLEIHLQAPPKAAYV